MTPLAQIVHPGSLENSYQQALRRIIEEQLNERLWRKDTSLWPAFEDQATSIEKNLAWLDLPQAVGPYITQVGEQGKMLAFLGIEDVLFVALGDSNLAARAILPFAGHSGLKNVVVLDSVDPDSIRAAESRLRLDRTAFMFASKSGKRIETHALMFYFMNRLREAGRSSPGERFVAITEKNSYLASLAQQYEFARIFLDPPGVSGRYSALIHFGLLLGGICLFEPAALLTHIAAVSAACGPGAVADRNPALTLTAMLAAAADTGHDRLIFLTTQSLAPLCDRVSQLVGVSSGKEGLGIVPIRSDTRFDLGALQRGCVVVSLAMKGDADTELRSAENSLRQQGVPIICIDLAGPEELPAEMFKWELATALFCSLLEVNPFHEPNVKESRGRAIDYVERLEENRHDLGLTVRVQEGGIKLFAEGTARQEISTLSLMDALRTFFDARDPHGYLAVLAFLDQNAAVEETLRSLQGQLQARLKIPVQLSFGPQYLHQLNQLFLGGPRKGQFLILTAEPEKDLRIPGANYTFGQLESALARGDFESLAHHDRLVVRLHLTQGARIGLQQLEEVAQKALMKTRSAGQ